MSRFFSSPRREYSVIVLVVAVFAADIFLPGLTTALLIVSAAGSVPTFWKALQSTARRTISIDTFNAFALVASFWSGEVRSSAFIVLMLSSASLLDWYTQSRAHSAIEEILKLKPLKASVEKNSALEEVPVDDVQMGDIVVVLGGARVPVDGTVVFGSAYVNEAPVSGESKLIEKNVGDTVVSGTLNESGVIKVRATRVGKDSTIERMAALVAEATTHKSHSERLADRFAQVFLPLVLVVGAVTYLLTHNLMMVTALFLVACADDMSVAIPLAATAAIGQAAKRGVIIKGSEWLEAIGKVQVLILDKTGTLTYGRPAIASVLREPQVDETIFWRLLGSAEKFSEHPVGRAIVREARAHHTNIPDPDEFKVYKGKGIVARSWGTEVVVGNEELLSDAGIPFAGNAAAKLRSEREKYAATTFLVYFDRQFAGTVTVADTPRPEARASMERLQELNLSRVVIFTGDNADVSARVGESLGIKNVSASMTPEKKLRELEELTKKYSVGMVGDGINDAPALSRANVGIAMGEGGTAVAVEAADIVVLTDDLSRVPEMIELGRKTSSVIRGDMVIWLISNAVGFALVFTGIAGPALAAFYNFATDFFPLLNSARLFRSPKTSARAATLSRK